MQQYLITLVQAAVDSKDTPTTREEQLHPLLSIFIGSTGEPWFSSWLDTTLASIYPQPSRTLLDAVLQAYIAAAPAHCGHVLQSVLRIPGSTSLNAPLRRDVAVLFRPNPQLHSSWQQQGTVCCSIVAFLADHAACHFHASQQQQQQVLLQQEHKQEQEQQQQQRHHHYDHHHHHHHHHHHPHQQQQDPFGGSSQPAVQTEAAAAAQHAGTAIGWLTDCLLQAAPEHKLQLLQIALATFVHRSTVLHAQQRVEQQQADHSVGAEPPVKRMRLAQQQEQVQAVQSAAAVAQHTDNAQQLAPGQEPANAVAGSTSSSSCGWQPASRAALLAGLQFLCAVSSCESFQRNSQQLLPLAAVLAAETAAASQAHFSTVSGSRLFGWLLLQLCSQVSAAPPPAATAVAAGAGITRSSTSVVGSVTQATAASATPAAALPWSKQQQQQQQSLGLAAPTAPGLAPAAALYQVVQYLSSVGPTQLSQLVSAKLMQTHNFVPGEVSTHAAKAAVAPTAVGCDVPAQQQSTEDCRFHAWLVEAANQWQQTRPAAGTSAMSGVGNKRGKGRRSTGAGSAAAGKVQQLGVEQLLPAAPAVTASWVCKYVVACLCQQSTLEWQQQQQQSSSAATSPAVAVLAQLLAADGLLLPPSGEVLVSACALGATLGILPVDLQEHLVRLWQQLLSTQQATNHAEAAAGGGAAASSTGAAQDEGQVMLPWATLQPMLCLLNHIGGLEASPIAAFLAAAVCRCLQLAHAANVSGTAAAHPGLGQGSGADCSVKDIVRHVLLPLRFKVQVQARVWLLQQLLCAGQGGKYMQGADAVVSRQTDVAVGFSAAGVGSTPDDATRAYVLQAVVELLSKDCAGQLSQGLQLLAAEREVPAAANQDSAASAGTMQLQQAKDLADAVLQLLVQLRGCEVDVGMSNVATEQSPVASAAAAAQQLRAVLVGAVGAAVCGKLKVS